MADLKPTKIFRDEDGVIWLCEIDLLFKQWKLGRPIKYIIDVQAETSVGVVS